MSRRRAAEKRQVLPDPIYNSVVLNKFINEVMVGGKKTIAQKIVYGALDIIKSNNQSDDPLEYFQKSYIWLVLLQTLAPRHQNLFGLIQ